MLIPASAIDEVMEEIIPTISKSNFASIFRDFHSLVVSTPGGTRFCGHTMESSSGVRVTEEKLPQRAQLGISSRAASLQIANESGRIVSESFGIFIHGAQVSHTYRYGLQYQVLFPYEEGHLSIGTDLNADVVEVAQKAAKYLGLPNLNRT